MNKITILDLNCFDISLFTIATRRTRLRRLAQEVISLHPNIICLQEINFLDTAVELTKTLKKNGYTVFPSMQKHFLNPGGLLTATTLPVENARFIKYTNQGKIFALDIFERIIARGYHVLTVRLPNNKLATIINTQLHCPFGLYESSIASDTAMDQYKELVATHPPSLHYILSGDLNIIPSNTLYKNAIRTLKDSLETTNKVTITSKNTHRKHLSQWEGRIDYTLLSKNLSRGAKAKIIFDTPIEDNGIRYHLSDHFGVWTEFAI